MLSCPLWSLSHWRPSGVTRVHMFLSSLKEHLLPSRSLCISTFESAWHLTHSRCPGSTGWGDKYMHSSFHPGRTGLSSLLHFSTQPEGTRGQRAGRWTSPEWTLGFGASLNLFVSQVGKWGLWPPQHPLPTLKLNANMPVSSHAKKQASFKR